VEVNGAITTIDNTLNTSNCVSPWYQYPYIYPGTTTLSTVLTPPEAWMAYLSDMSSLVIFPTEIEALRHAVEQGMQVKRLGWGENIHKQVTAKTAKSKETK
jgi:hypothetical protein